MSMASRTILLYRHYDGYPAHCGAEVVPVVAVVLDRCPSAAAVAQEFLRRHYPAEADRPARPIDELSDGRDVIEEFYFIDLTERTIGYACRPESDSGKR
jgi:hypothetical protein